MKKEPKPVVYVHEKKLKGEDLVEWFFMGLIVFVLSMIGGGVLGALWQAARTAAEEM
jgi:hypothetical protein